MLRAVEKTFTLPALLIVLTGGAMAGGAMAAPALPGSEPAAFGLGLEPRTFPFRASPPRPDPATFPVQLVLDDDDADSVFGFLGSTARQFLWFNRFASPGPFNLEEIWVLFPSTMDVPLGGQIQLAVYLDPDGDPTTGAQLLATYDEVIQAADGNTFSVYPLAAPLAVDSPGDVLIGAVNRFFTTGVDPPPTLPAAFDITASQDRSYFALWTSDAPDPPDLATATVVDVLDGAVSGNFLIRGFGTPIAPSAIPALGGTGLALLAALLALAGAALTRRLSS